MIKAIAISRIIALVYIILFSPCLLALLPDTKRRRQRHIEEHRVIREELNRQNERQDHIEQEQEIIRQEQQKQAEQISKLRFQIEQLETDIENDKIRLGRLFALLDIAENTRAAAVPGSRTDEVAMRRIVVLESQISAAERRIRAAEFKRQTAQQKLGTAA